MFRISFPFFKIDFQICKFATPAIDLIYALYYFLSTENRKTRRAEIIAIYHEEFVDALKKFGYLKSPPSLMDLQVELLKNGFFEVIVSVCMSIFFYMDFGKLIEMGLSIDMTAPGEGFKILYEKAPGFKEYILQEIPRWCYNGFI